MKKQEISTHSDGNSKLFPVVAIGASAGGLEAVSEFVKNLPHDTGMAFVYIPHLDPTHESMLANILARQTSMPVQKAEHLLPVEPDHLYILPPDKSMTIIDGLLTLESRQPRPAINLPVDRFFVSLAENHKGGAIGIILSGNAHDGTLGLRAIKMAGGLTFAQDDSAQFKSMPKSAIAEGYVDLVLSPYEMAMEIARISKKAGLITQAIDDAVPPEIKKEDLTPILDMVRKSSGVDFRYYKVNTIKRRVTRRMLLHKLNSFEEYADYLRRHPAETPLLLADLLINVTSFFREPDILEYLKKVILPKILKEKAPGEAVRLWIPACSTGEEAYSLAMIIDEIMAENGSNIPVQIFATDLSEKSIAKARTGVYSKSDVAGVSPKRIERFFTKVEGSYRINKPIRDLCVFAPHNVFTDPPFSRLDLISCCNLMIYLDAVLQKKILATFYYALKHDGYLVLGKSETLVDSKSLFSHVEKKYKVFMRRNDGGDKPKFEMNHHLPGTAQRRESDGHHSGDQSTETSLEKTVKEVLLAKYVPACVVIDKELNILEFHGPVGPFLEFAPGKATLNLLKMVRPALVVDLSATVHKAIKSRKVEKKSGIEVNADDTTFAVSVEVVPVNQQNDDTIFLVVFERVSPSVGAPGQSDEGLMVKKLREELEVSKEEMRAVLEEQQAINEELQSANEEIVSSNEELQSINEELETSNEEVESANEELLTINTELMTRNQQLAESHEYAQAVIETICEAVLILDDDFRVISANKAFYTTFRVKEEETEGMLLYELGNRQWDILELRQLLEQLVAKSTTINGFEVQHNFPQIGVKVMLLHARTVIQKTHQKQLIILAIEDITEHRAVQRAAEERELQFRNMADNAPVIIWTSSIDKTRNFFNRTWFDYTGQTKSESPDWRAAIHPDDREKYIKNFDKRFNERAAFQMEYLLRRNDGEYRWLMDVAKPHFSPNQEFLGYIGTSTELHDKKVIMEELNNQVKKGTQELRTMNNELQRSNSELQQFAFVASHDLQEPLRKIITYIDRIQNHEQNLSDVGRGYFEKIIHSSRRMTKLIDDLLDFSSLSFANKKFIKVDLNKTLQDVLSDLDLIILEKNAEVTHTTDLPIIDAVPLQMTQLFHNLITNALKFAKENTPSKIDISSRMLSQEEVHERKTLDGNEAEYVEIVFRDNGIGFNPEFAEQIFVIFQRLNDKKKFPGTGIGLALCRRIVNNHRGDIFAQSTPDGAAFHVILPLRQIVDAKE